MLDNRRVLSLSEKSELYYQSKGLCSKCQKPLDEIWEAHHKIRWIDGGKTNLNNMEAVCSKCHKEIHKNYQPAYKQKELFMKENDVKLREWQKEAFNKFKMSDKKTFLLNACPAAGKTWFAIECGKYMFNSPNEECNHILYIVPSDSLRQSITKELNEKGEKKYGVDIYSYVKSNQGRPKDIDWQCTTYSNISGEKMLQTLKIWHQQGAKFFFIFDEIHHAKTHEDSEKISVWGNAIHVCESLATRMLIMTGTPFRNDGYKIPFVNYDENGMAVADYNYAYREGVKDGICRPTLFKYNDGFAEYCYKNETLNIVISNASSDNLSNIAKTIFKHNSNWLKDSIIAANNDLDDFRKKYTKAAGLIFVGAKQHYKVDNSFSQKDKTKIEKDIEDKHIHLVAKLVKKLTNSDVVTVTYQDKDASDKIKNFKNSNDKWIIAINMISEGVDIPRVRVGLMADNTLSELLFRQRHGRFIRVDMKNDLLVEPKYNKCIIHIPAFPHYKEMAESIMKEAEAGLKERDNKPPTDCEGKPEYKENIFIPLNSGYEYGGCSQNGECFTKEEWWFAESEKQNPKKAHLDEVDIILLAREWGIDTSGYNRNNVIDVDNRPKETIKKELKQEIDKIVKDILTAKRIFPYNKSEYGKEIAKYNNLINQRLGVTQRDVALAECTVSHWQDVKKYALELLKGI